MTKQLIMMCMGAIAYFWSHCQRRAPRRIWMGATRYLICSMQGMPMLRCGAVRAQFGAEHGRRGGLRQQAARSVMSSSETPMQQH
jgi:hypothetical protein